MSVSAGLRETFERDGYAVVDSGLSAAVLDGIVADVAPFYKKESDPRVLYNDERRIQDAWRVSQNVLKAALHPPLLETLQELYGRKPLPFQTLNFRYGSEQRPHSDTIHFNSKPAGFMCGVWLALEDIDSENGPLVYYPGSHRLPEVTFDDIGVRPHHSNYTQYEDFIEEIVENRSAKIISDNKLQVQYGLIKKGQAILWAANLIHGGAPQNDKNRTRHSLVTHVYFEGCRYWSPMHSNRRFTYWRYPNWIAEGAVPRRNLPSMINSLRWRAARALRVI